MIPYIHIGYLHSVDWSAGMEYWNGVTGMESLEWRILDRVSSRNFILGGKLTDHVAVRPWRGEGRP